MPLRIPLFRSNSDRSSSSTLVLVVALLVSVALARHAAAQTFDQIIEQFQDVQNAMIEAAAHSQAGEAAEALTTIDDALALVQSIRDSLTDPTIAEELGKKLKKVQKGLNRTDNKINRARVIVEKGRKVKVQLKKLKVGAKSALKCASKVGRPVVGEINARSAGFHNPGQVVRFQIYNADGSPCLEQPVVEVSNQPLSSAIDLNSVTVDEVNGVITLTMGQEQGGGSVTVTACGRTDTVLVYNYGPKVPAGLPDGFPTNLPKGNYRLTYSASGTGISIPETLIGTLALTDLKSFSKQLVNAFNTAINSISVLGCSQRVNYSSYNGVSFTVTYSVTCTVEEYSATVTVVFRIQKI